MHLIKLYNLKLVIKNGSDNEVVASYTSEFLV